MTLDLMAVGNGNLLPRLLIEPINRFISYAMLVARFISGGKEL